MKKLIVFFKVHTMSDHVAKKAACEGKKGYRVKQKQAEYPEGTSFEAASEDIYRQFGRRPDNGNPFKSIVVPHSFAEIVSYTIAESRVKPDLRPACLEDQNLTGAGSEKPDSPSEEKY